jgi:nondiscriminating glutamyl-tRNA synthetase
MRVPPDPRARFGFGFGLTPRVLPRVLPFARLNAARDKLRAMTVRVRFAPSPTGHLHVGGARTAIFNWLFAKHHSGDFIIRVEDTDQARSTRESEQMVLDDLRWLRLDWVEGPDVGGPHAPYRQSERVELYGRVANELVERGVAYRCYCSEEELEAKRKQAEEENRPPHYDLTCWNNRRTDAAPHAIRFHVPEDGDVTIDDAIRGEVTWRKESLGDFIIVRTDRLPTYNFSVVVDDHDMAITHVIRAEEHLTNTHRQVLIYRAMEWSVPQFAHVSLILGQDRSKLSKRHGATSVAQYAEDGYLPEAMVNYLTLLGWSSPDGFEVFGREYAIKNFSFDRVNAAAAVFDPQKLEWVNGQLLHAMSAQELRGLIEDSSFDAPAVPRESLVDAIDLMKTTVTTLAGFRDALSTIWAGPTPGLLFGLSPELKDQALALAPAVEAEFEEHGVPLTADDFKSMTSRLAKRTGLKGRTLFMPLRILVTGSEHGPELARLVPLIEQASRVNSKIDSIATRVRRTQTMLSTA